VQVLGDAPQAPILEMKKLIKPFSSRKIPPWDHKGYTMIWKAIFFRNISTSTLLLFPNEEVCWYPQNFHLTWINQHDFHFEKPTFKSQFCHLLQVTLKFHAEVEVKFLAHTTTDGAG
jgi:hypothetical protein